MRIFTSICVSIFLLAGLTAAAQTIQINRDNKTVAINTSDEATTIADIAAINIGFELYGPDAQSATAEGGKTSHKILEALHKAGVEDSAIESSQQGVQRNNDFDEKEKPDQRVQKQFKFHQSWEVSVSPQNAANVIHLAIAAGANSSGNIDWRLTDRKALQAKAAEAALVKARAVAEKMADGLHIKLGALIYASNESPKVPFFIMPRKTQPAAWTTESAALSIIALPMLEIRPQTIREEATVYAVFAIE